MGGWMDGWVDGLRIAYNNKESERAKRAGIVMLGRCPSQPHCVKASLEAFFGYSTLVGHLNKSLSVILQSTLVVHIELVI